MDCLWMNDNGRRNQFEADHGCVAGDQWSTCFILGRNTVTLVTSVSRTSPLIMMMRYGAMQTQHTVN